ncbi:MAG: response regulator [Thiolinea sp.]
MQDTQLNHYSIPGVDLQLGLQRAEQSSDIYFRFLRNMHGYGKHYHDHLQQALQENNTSKLRQRVHGLYGVAATLGAWQLAHSCSELLATNMTEMDAIPAEPIVNVFHDLDRLIRGIEQSGLLAEALNQPLKHAIYDGPLRVFTLLFIEDDPILTEVFISELQKYFGTTVWLKYKKEALDYLQQQNTFKHLIIICDVKLPDGSGLDIAREVSRREPDTLILLVSGSAITDEELTGIHRSIQLKKPFGVAEIINLSKGLALNLLSQQAT